MLSEIIFHPCWVCRVSEAGILHAIVTTAVSLNNPAGRLYEALSSARDKGATNILTAFATALGENPKDPARVFLKVGMLYQAIDEVSEQLKPLNDADFLDLYLESVPRLKAALNIISFNAAWESHKNLIRDEDLKTLKYCSAKLSKASFEPALSEEQIADLKNKVAALYEEVLKSKELDPQLQRLVLDHLEAIRRAIHDYKVRGIRPIAEALSITMLTLVVNDPEKEPVTDESNSDEKPKSKTTMDKVRQFIKDATVVIGFWNLVFPPQTHLPQLVEAFEKIKGYLS